MLAEALPPADVEDALPPVALLLEELLLELFELEVELEEELFVFELLLLLVVVLVVVTGLGGWVHSKESC